MKEDGSYVQLSTFSIFFSEDMHPSCYRKLQREVLQIGMDRRTIVPLFFEFGERQLPKLQDAIA